MVNASLWKLTCCFKSSVVYKRVYIFKGTHHARHSSAWQFSIVPHGTVARSYSHFAKCCFSPLKVLHFSDQQSDFQVQGGTFCGRGSHWYADKALGRNNECEFGARYFSVNPFSPESDQCQNSPAASQEIWHHTVWRTWLFIAYSDEKWLYYKFSLHHSYSRFLKGWENALFELRSERVNMRESSPPFLSKVSEKTTFMRRKFASNLSISSNFS